MNIPLDLILFGPALLLATVQEIFHTAIFENGYIKLAGGKLIDNGKEVSFENNTEAKDLGINIKLSNGYAREIQYFTDCLKAGKKPEMVTIDSSAASIALVKETLAKAVQI